MEISVMIEIPSGCRNKYEYDHVNKVMRFDRMLFSSVHYPSDYGFVIDTLGEDGDPLDVLVVVWEPTFPGCVMDVKPIGVFKMSDDKGVDQKIICVPISDPLWNHIKELKDLPPHLLPEIEHFFSIYKDLEQKKVHVEGWGDRIEAEKIVKESQARFKKS